MLLRFLCISAAAVGLLFQPAVASAASYLVMSCTDPLGQPNAAVGWTPSSSPGGLTANSCGTPNGVLKAWLPDANPPGTASAAWRFTAPPGTRIIRFTGRRTTSGLGPGTHKPDIHYLLTTDDGQVLEECAPAPGSSCADVNGAIDKQGLNGAWVEFRVLCEDVGRTCTRALSVEATQMWPTLDDPTPPAVTNPQVIDDGDHPGSTGNLRIRYDASDVGGGLYRTIVKVDGTVAQTVPLAPAPCADVNPNDGDPFQFAVPVPCPTSVTGAEAVVEAAKLADRPHGVEIAVQDAAGNERSVFGPVEFPKANVPTGASSTPAKLANIRHASLRMWFVKARRHGRTYIARYGTRVVVRGVLRGADGHGIQGARIDVYHIRNGKKRLQKTGLKSRAGGKVTLILPLNVDTRGIEFAYRALRPGPVTSRVRLRLTVVRHGKVFRRK
jgi:hypothetical protein